MNSSYPNFKTANSSRAFKAFLDVFLVFKETEEGSYQIGFSAECDIEEDIYEGRISGSPLLGIKEGVEGSFYACFIEKIKSLYKRIKSLICLIQEKEEAQEAKINYIEEYFELLDYLVEYLDQATTEDTLYIRKCVEMLTKLGCCRIKSENTYWITDLHPLMMLHQIAELDTQAELNHFDNITEEQLVRDIVTTKNIRRKQFKLCTANEVFLCMASKNIRDDAVVHMARLFSEQGKLSNIQAIRLIEKIEDYKAKYSDGNNKVNIKIACFGELNDVELLEDYFRETAVELEIVEFQRNKTVGEYYFIEKNSNKGKVEQRYNLLDQFDLEQLCRNFQIILLLDNSYFYKQRQAIKTIEERNETMYANWYFQRAKRMDQIKDKRICYENGLEYINMWINSNDKGQSGKYEFDVNLYNAFDNVTKERTDVYLYISQGNKIAGENLYHQNVCNDEFYDGNDLIVYRFKKRETDINKSLIEFPGKTDGEGLIYIDLWKFIKSISNSFYSYFLNNRINCSTKEEQIEFISKLKHTFCIIDYNNSKVLSESNKKIKYRIVSEEQLDTEYKTALEELVKIVLEYIFGKNERAICVSRYLKRLLVSSIISRAGCVNDLLFAYLLRKNIFIRVDIQLTKDDDILEKQDLDIANGFMVRRTIYSIIEKIDNIRLRNTENLEEYFMINFRSQYCKDVTQDAFRKVMERVYAACKEFDYKESNLEAYSKMN